MRYRTRLTRFSLVLSVAVLLCSSLYAIGCVSLAVLDPPPPCPVMNSAAINEMEDMMAGGQFMYVEDYIGQMDRYCEAIDTLRGD